MELCDVRMIIGDFFCYIIFIHLSAKSISLAWRSCTDCIHKVQKYTKYLVECIHGNFPKIAAVSTTGWRGTYESAGWCFRKCLICNVHISHTATSKGKGNNRDDCLLGTQENQILVKSLLVSEIILTRLLAATEVESSSHNPVG